MITESEERACRVCGCTQNNACINDNGPCWWVEEDLCSHCPPTATSKNGIFGIVTTPETKDEDIEVSNALTEGSGQMLDSTDGSCTVYNAIQYGRYRERLRLASSSYKEVGAHHAGRPLVMAEGAITDEDLADLKPSGIIVGMDLAARDSDQTSIRLADGRVFFFPASTPFQRRVHLWMLACFGEEISRDREERNHRFLEEALELVQSCGCTVGEAHQLVDYVFGRKEGEPAQEVGGVMVTLAALCQANDLDMHDAAEMEIGRIWDPQTIEKIRAKQAAKPKHSPLPIVTAVRQPSGTVVRSYPDELTTDLSDVLSTMLWDSGRMAHVLRAGGWAIKTKAEAEQAAVLHWFIKLALEHGPKWREVASYEVLRILAEVKKAEASNG